MSLATGTLESSAGRSAWKDVRHTLRSLCPQSLLNWREARFYGRYGEVELHLVEFLCRRDRDAIDIGANDGSYEFYLLPHARHVIAFEPMPALAQALRTKFRRGVTVEAMALSNRSGTASLCMPVVDGIPINGCSTISSIAAAKYPGHQPVEVPMDTLDDVYEGEAGFIKIDVEGHQQAVLDGAFETIRRCRPRVLVEIIERMSPGGLKAAQRMFSDLHYTGYFVHKGQLRPIHQFSLEAMQNERDIPPLRAHLSTRGRFGKYLYNFIFVPAEEERRLAPKLEARLRKL